MNRSLLSIKPASLKVFIVLVAGIAMGNYSTDVSFLSFGLLVVAFLITFLSLFYFKKYSFNCFLSLIFLFGFILIQSIIYQTSTNDQISELFDSKKFKITGQVYSIEKKSTLKYKMVLRHLVIHTGKTDFPVKGKIILNVYYPEKNRINRLDTISFYSKIRSIRNFSNPGGFDYKKYLIYRNIFGRAYSKADQIEIARKKKSIGTLILQSIQSYRDEFSAFVINHGNDNLSSNVILSISSGEKYRITHKTRDTLSKAGISHLLAISGLHFSILAYIFYRVFYSLFCLNKKWIISGVSRKLSGLIALIPLSFYLLFSGNSPSAQRAFIMMAVFMIGFVVEKETDLFSNLWIAGIIILIFDATSLYSISFQLSFFAVFFIISGLPILTSFNVFKNSYVSKIFMMAGVSLIAGIGTGPLTAYYFNTISFIGPILNLIAIPIIGFLVLPLSILSLLLFKICPFIAAFFIHTAGCLVVFVTNLAEWVVQFPLTWHRITSIGIGQIILLYGLLVLVLVFFKLKDKRWLILFFIFIVYSSINISAIFKNKDFNQYLKVTVLDVGQGLSTVIQTADDQSIIVDGGGFSGQSTFDTGRFIISPFLYKQKITNIDYMILSHPESDHLTGLIHVLENFKVKFVIKNNDQKNSQLYKKFIRICNKKKIPILTPKDFQHSLLVGKLKLIFYGEEKSHYNLNNNSVVFKLIFNDFSMLFPGDILSERESLLTNRYKKQLKSNVLVAPHHGSLSSSSKIFLDKVMPQSVIISCGWLNRYGFPDDRIIQRYQAKNVRIFRTDNQGAITVLTNGDTYIINIQTGG